MYPRGSMPCAADPLIYPIGRIVVGIGLAQTTAAVVVAAVAVDVVVRVVIVVAAAAAAFDADIEGTMGRPGC